MMTMLFEAYTVSEDTRMRLERAEVNAARAWRYRGLRRKEWAFAAAVLSGILGLFFR